MVVRSQGESQPRIAAIVSRAISSFGSLASALDGTLPESSAAASHLARFKLWAGTLGAHRVAGSRSLEYRLRDASSIRNHIISLLQDLCDALDDGILAAKGTAEGVHEKQVSAVVGDSTDADLEDYFREDSQEGGSEISAILDGVGHIVDCLLRLSITIRNPAPHDHFKSRAGTDVINPYEQWDIKHVCEKFPNADHGIAKRLGKATARRRQYFKYREEHAMKLSEGLDAGDDGEREEKGERATTIASSIPDRLKESQVIADFADLNDIESTVSKTSYALSTADETQLRVPPLPKEHADGPFGCPYCCMIVSINTRHEWKKHVFRDLRPYVCLSPSCTTPEQQYLRRSDWMEHMKRDHWRIWQCPFGCPDTFHSAREFEQHVSGAHPSREPPRNLDTLQRLSSQPDYLARAKGQCPLCLDFQIMSDKQYGSHVGAHLEQLALFALPSTAADGDESDDTESESSGQDGKKYDTESLDSVREGGPLPETAPAEEETERVIEALKAKLLKVKEHVEKGAKARTPRASDVEILQVVNRQLDELLRLDNGKEVEGAGIDAEKKPDPEIEAMQAQLAEYEGDNKKRAEEERLAAAFEAFERAGIKAEKAVRERIYAERRAQAEREQQEYEEKRARLERRLAAESKAAEKQKRRQAGETQTEAQIDLVFTDEEGKIYHPSTAGEEATAVEEDAEKVLEEAIKEQEEKLAAAVEAERKKMEAAQETETQWEVHDLVEAARKEIEAAQEAKAQAKARIEPGTTEEQQNAYDQTKTEEEAEPSEEAEEAVRYPGAWIPGPVPRPNESSSRQRSGGHQSRSPSSSPEHSSAGDAEQAATDAFPGRPLQQINLIAARFIMVLRPLCEDFINIPPSTVGELTEKRRSITEDVMRRILLPLDGIDTMGDAAARARRKEVVVQVQSVLRRMDAVELPSVNEGGG